MGRPGASAPRAGPMQLLRHYKEETDPDRIEAIIQEAHRTTGHLLVSLDEPALLIDALCPRPSPGGGGKNSSNKIKFVLCYPGAWRAGCRAQASKHPSPAGTGA